MAEKIASNTKHEKYPIGSLEEMSQRWQTVGGGGARDAKRFNSTGREDTATNGLSTGGFVPLDPPPSSRYRPGY